MEMRKLFSNSELKSIRRKGCFRCAVVFVMSIEPALHSQMNLFTVVCCILTAGNTVYIQMHSFFGG